MVVEVVAVEAVEAGVEHVVAGAGVQGPPRPPATPTALPGLRLGIPTNNQLLWKWGGVFLRYSPVSPDVYLLPTAKPKKLSLFYHFWLEACLGTVARLWTLDNTGMPFTLSHCVPRRA